MPSAWVSLYNLARGEMEGSFESINPLPSQISGSPNKVQLKNSVLNVVAPTGLQISLAPWILSLSPPLGAL